MKTIEINGDYLIIAPNKALGLGNYKMLTERDFLDRNIENFLNAHLDVARENITVYELRKVDWQEKIR